MTFTGRNGRTLVEVSVTPAEPSIGEEVMFDFLVRYEGTGDERDAQFALNRYIEGAKEGHHSRPDCAADAYDPNSIRRTEKRIRDVQTFDYPGPYEVYFSASAACLGGEKDAFAEGEISVSGTPDLPPGVVLLPHSQSEGSTLIGTTDISIEGDAKTKCVWATIPSGKRWATLWPIGYRARFDPLRIYDDKEQEVWREGDERESPGQPNGRVRRVPTRCRVGDSVFTMHRAD